MELTPDTLPPVREVPIRVVAALAPFLVAAGIAVSALASSHAGSVTTISVVAGKPLESSVRLSENTSIPAGTVVFRVLNKGLLVHVFKICSTPTPRAALTACRGKATAPIKPGNSVKLSVTLGRGSYEFLATMPGHAGVSKGLITLVTTASGTGAPTTPASTAGTTAPAGTAPASTGCMIDGTPC